jgi:hypothetical protein
VLRLLGLHCVDRSGMMYKITVRVDKMNTLVRRARPSEPETSTTEVLVSVLADDPVSALAKAQNLLVAEMTWLEHERPQLKLSGGEIKNPFEDDDEEEEV